MTRFLTAKLLITLLFILLAVPPGGQAAKIPADLVLENASLLRAFSTADGRLRTSRIMNKLSGVPVSIPPGPEFRLRISRGTHREDTDVVLTTDDFTVTATRAFERDGRHGLSFTLAQAEHPLTMEVRYTLHPDESVVRKTLHLRSEHPLTLERIDVEAHHLTDAYQPYTKDAITAHAPGNWSPNIGQPLYTRDSGTFWGIEFPAARNQVQDGQLTTGYLWGRELQPGQTYTSYAAVMGVGDNPAFIADAFQAYIDRIRCRPLRLQVQYNSWFDYGRGVNQESFARSVDRIHQELVETRGVHPLSRYVIDDGWQDVHADWSNQVWKVNEKFAPDFAGSRAACAAADSRLGLWMSPGCLFGASRQVAKLREQGFEAMDDWMSMAGPRYMQRLEDRMADLTRQGVGFFKLDGVFGHLNLRNFELQGDRYGMPTMPQLGLEGLKAGSAELNDPKYDELKLYYLTAGTERLIDLFTRLGEIDPDIYLLISNGAYLSPWWLMHIDAVWMINAGDAAGGSSRTQELVYRDGRYHVIFGKEQTQFPLNAVFNHEPKKRKTGETKDVFRKYLYMNLSRGTGFVELYIKPFVLQPYDWDVLAEGLHWAREVFPCFTRTRMHGGDPKQGEVYGYTGWTPEMGYVSLHNPSHQEQTYSFKLDRAFGLHPDSGAYQVSSPLDGSAEGLPSPIGFGKRVSIDLAPGEIRIIHFDRETRDWSRLKALQVRTPGPVPVVPPPIDDHAILGTWQYTYHGADYTRRFGKDGFCTLRRGDHVEWKKPFQVNSPTQAVIQGNLLHDIQADGLLRIEGGHYTARRVD